MRLNQTHEKELAKLQAKLAKYESSREELVKEKNESSKEVAGLKSEIRELESLSQFFLFASSSSLRIVVPRSSIIKVDQDRIAAGEASNLAPDPSIETHLAPNFSRTISTTERI